MANQLVSLLDITKRSGSDQAIGLLEETTTFAPELDVLMGRPISGTVYRATSRTLPTVSFRKANDGSDTVKSAYSQKLAECFIIDAQMQADKAIVDAEAKSGVNTSVGDILFDEAQGVLLGAGITVGAQFYYGTNSDAQGFNGIQSLLGALNTGTGPSNPPPVIGAGGTTSNAQTSVYLVWNHIRGCHFVWGNNQGLSMMPEWRVQQVQGNNNKPMTAYVNNLQGWIGLAVNHTKSVARIANCEDATNKRLTDALGAKLLSYIPMSIQNSGGLRWFMNQQAAYQLQVSRTASTSITSEKPLAFPATPTEMCGIPITITNSITNTESVVS
jgi:hypothetical protein